MKGDDFEVSAVNEVRASFFGNGEEEEFGEVESDGLR